MATAGVIDEDHDISDETLAKVTPLVEQAVRIRGHLVGPKKGTRESANCGGTAGYDFHLWLLDEPGEDQDKISNEELRGYKATALVIEPTPRWKVKNPSWKCLAKFKHLIAQKRRCASPGGDSSIPSTRAMGKERAPRFGIHPVTNIEYWSGGQWHRL